MSRRWGEKVEEDFQIPRSGSRRHRAFADGDEIEIVVEGPETPESGAKEGTDPAPMTRVPPEVDNEVPEEEPDPGEGSPGPVIPRMLPHVFLLVLGMVIGSWLGSAGEKGLAAYEGVCGAYKALQDSDTKSLEPGDNAEASETMASLAHELDQICNRPKQQAAKE